MNRSSAVIKGAPQIPNPIHHVRTQQEGGGYEPGRGPLPEHEHVGDLILGFTASRTVRKKFLIYKLPSLRYFVMEV